MLRPSYNAIVNVGVKAESAYRPRMPTSSDFTAAQQLPLALLPALLFLGEVLAELHDAGHCTGPLVLS
jgi:hypothetical protein